MRLTTTLFTASLLMGTSTVMAQTLYNSFVNCISAGGAPTTNVFTGQAASSSDNCVATCVAFEYRYAYYTRSADIPGTVVGGPACSCSNTQPPIPSFTRTTALGDVSCFTPTDYQVFLLQTNNGFDGCSRGGGDRGPSIRTEPFTLEECLTTCATYDTIYFQANPSANRVTCYCFTGAVPVATRCGTGEENNYYTTFRREVRSVPSGGLRKRSSKAIYCDNYEPGSLCDSSVYHESMSLTQDYCPVGKTACNVAGQPGAYECLDTNSELESCGGCIDGEFGKENSTLGVDCTTAFPNADLASVTCSAGACLLY